MSAATVRWVIDFDEELDAYIAEPRVYRGDTEYSVPMQFTTPAGLAEQCVRAPEFRAMFIDALLRTFDHVAAQERAKRLVIPTIGGV